MGITIQGRLSKFGDHVRITQSQISAPVKKKIETWQCSASLTQIFFPRCDHYWHVYKKFNKRNVKTEKINNEKEKEKENQKEKDEIH